MAATHKEAAAIPVCRTVRRKRHHPGAELEGSVPVLELAQAPRRFGAVSALTGVAIEEA
jgi:hypothetical protein